MSPDRTQATPSAMQDELEADVPGLSVGIGDPIPSVGLRASDGYLLNLRSFVGRQLAVFVFFAAPTAQGAQLRRGTRLAEVLAAGARRLEGAGVALVGITCDGEEQQRAWIDEHHFPYLLFSDERRSAVDRLGIPLTEVDRNYNVARPVVLVAGRDGRLAAIISDPEPDYAVEIVLAAARRAEGRDAEDRDGEDASPTPDQQPTVAT
jgi:peroxiredoxin